MSSKNAKVSFSSPSPSAFFPFALAIIAPFLFLCYLGPVYTYLRSISAALSRPSAGLFPEQQLVIELKRGMTSDRGQNRYSLFMAPQTLLRFKNCSSSYCLLSPWCRFHVFKSCRSFVSSYCFLRVTTGLSSCREIFLSL